MKRFFLLAAVLLTMPLMGTSIAIGFVAASIRLGFLAGVDLWDQTTDDLTRKGRKT
jgi:hypothetical protein